MTQFAVHLYPTVRVKVVGIEAGSIEEAVAKAEASVDLHAALDNLRPSISDVEAIEWDEGTNNFVLVDPLDDSGEVVFAASQWLEGDGTPLVGGKTAIERKAAAADEAALFMQELLDSVETLGCIAEVHGPRTLVDLMYLQTAILKGSFIDHYPDESAVGDIASALPSGERWALLIKKEDVAQREAVRS